MSLAYLLPIFCGRCHQVTDHVAGGNAITCFTCSMTRIADADLLAAAFAVEQVRLCPYCRQSVPGSTDCRVCRDGHAADTTGGPSDLDRVWR